MRNNRAMHSASDCCRAAVGGRPDRDSKAVLNGSRGCDCLGRALDPHDVRLQQQSCVACLASGPPRCRPWQWVWKHLAESLPCDQQDACLSVACPLDLRHWPKTRTQLVRASSWLMLAVAVSAVRDHVSSSNQAAKVRATYLRCLGCLVMRAATVKAELRKVHCEPVVHALQLVARTGSTLSKNAEQGPGPAVRRRSSVPSGRLEAVDCRAAGLAA